MNELDLIVDFIIEVLDWAAYWINLGMAIDKTFWYWVLISITLSLILYPVIAYRTK